MRKSVVLLVLLVCVLGVAKAEQSGDQKKLGLTFDLTYTSRWMSKGIDVYRNQGGFFATLDFDLYGTGFGVRVTHRNSTGPGYVDSQRFDYRPYYKGTLFDGESYKTNFDISVGYENYYGLDRYSAITEWEWIGVFAWPELIGNGFVPKYVFHYEHPANSPISLSSVSGWVHRFILDYNMNIEAFPNPVKFSSEIGLYDGLLGRVSDWGYTTFGLSSKFNVDDDLAIVPGIYYQITMDDIMLDGKNEDVFYCMTSLKYTF